MYHSTGRVHNGTGLPLGTMPAPPPPLVPAPPPPMPVVPAPPLARIGVNPACVEVCYFHGNCHDGACAAALLKAAATPHCMFVPCWWESADPSKCVGRTVVFLDLTPVPELLSRVSDVAKETFVVDHHESAQDVLVRMLTPHQYLYDNRECGASLVWRWLQTWALVPAVGPPPVLPYVRALDLFDWSDLEAEGVADAMRVSRALEMRTEPMLAKFEEILGQGQGYIDSLRAGLSITDEIVENQINKSVSSAVLKSLARYPHVRVAVINTQNFLNHVAHRLRSTLPVQLVWLWYFHGPSHRVRVMLRAYGKFDCHMYAKDFDGGGHAGAASFTCEYNAMWHHFHGRIASAMWG